METIEEWRPTTVPCSQCGEPLWQVHRTFRGFNFSKSKPGEYECRSRSNCVGRVAP